MELSEETILDLLRFQSGYRMDWPSTQSALARHLGVDNIHDPSLPATRLYEIYETMPQIKRYVQRRGVHRIWNELTDQAYEAGKSIRSHLSLIERLEDPGDDYADSVDEAIERIRELERNMAALTEEFEASIDWAQVRILDLERDLRLARTGLALAKSMILSGESMSDQASETIQRGLRGELHGKIQEV